MGCRTNFVEVQEKLKFQFRKINPLNMWIENRQLKKIIKQWAYEIMSRLKLPTIKIEFDLWYANCSYTAQNSLLFGLWFLKTLEDKDRHKEAVPSMEFFDRVYFVVAHEIAHYLQKYKCPKWHEKYLKEDKKISTNTSIHVKQKIERNASKIAGILLKEYKLSQNNT